MDERGTRPGNVSVEKFVTDYNSITSDESVGENLTQPVMENKQTDGRHIHNYIRLYEVKLSESGEEGYSLLNSITEKVPWWSSCRLLLAFVAFLGFVNLYSLRLNLSVAIVCMVNYTALAAPLGENINQSGGVETCTTSPASESQRSDGEFLWNTELRGTILSSFFWGYCLTQAPAGWLAVRFGGRRVVGYSMLTVIVATLLTPVGARWSSNVLIGLQFIKGLGEGLVFPAVTELWRVWAPPQESSMLLSLTYSGMFIGSAISLPISGALCEHGFDGGWPSVFYVFGIFGLLWLVLWMVLISDSPAQHPRISAIERQFIEASIVSSNTTMKMSIPWRAVARSMPNWAIIVAHIAGDWVEYTLQTDMPTYLREFLKFDAQSIGLLSTIPYLTVWLFFLVSGVVADKLKAGGMTTKNVRKSMYAVGAIFPIIFLVAIGHITCKERYLGVALLTLALGFSAVQFPAHLINPLDIAPPFAAQLFGIASSIGTVSGILSPYATGIITADGTQEQWRIVFYLAAVISGIGAIFYSIFADGEIQEWVKPYLDQKNDLLFMKESVPTKNTDHK